MQKIIFASLSLVILAVAPAPAVTCQPVQVVELGYAPNEIIVKFHETVANTVETQLNFNNSADGLKLSQNLNELNARYRTKKIKPLFKNFKARRQHLKNLLKKDNALLSKKERHILRRLKRAPKGAKVPGLDRIYKLEVEQGQSLQEIVAAYNSDPDVEYAELNYIVSIYAEPNDPLYSIQWPLNNIGQMYPESGYYDSPPGTLDCDIDAPEAWDIFTGNSDIIVAVIDTGVDYRHRDLQNNIWINEAELNGIATVDDDENGYKDDIYGYNFVYSNNDPLDDHGHGTHCAGVIAAQGNNGTDIAGLCWNAKIMALKFLGSNGSGSTFDAVSAFYYAVENGADVTSNSWGGSSYSETMEEVINYAHSQGVIMVAAAGNNDNTSPHYPAYYNNMIAVAATGSNDQKASFSTYGDWVDIAAPGVDILSLRADGTSMGTTYDDYTTIASGTSMACPHMAGACALLLSAPPFKTNDEVFDILMETVDPIAPEICLSGGRLNLFNAMYTAVSSQGYIILDEDGYSCSGTISILLADSDILGEGNHGVTLTTSGGDLETVILTEITPVFGVFTGTILTNSVDPNLEDGILQLSHGQIITATYEDSDDGTGNPATVTDTAVADCESPVIFNVQIEIHGIEAKITFETNEPTTARVLCDPNCGGPYSIERYDEALSTTHNIRTIGLTAETDYYFTIETTDAVGNESVDDNSGACYSFTTSTPFVLRVPSEFATIQAAIDEAWGWGDETVLVADGTYKGYGNRDLDFHGKAITVCSEFGPENCIIDCNGTSDTGPHRGFYFYSGEDQNSIVDGFTITNGYGTRKHVVDWTETVGGAIFCKYSNPTIMNCIIRDNYATNYGQMYNEHSSPVVINCTFTFDVDVTDSHNSGTGMGNVGGSHPTVVNCTFNGTQGYGMFNEQSSPTVTNCTFSGQYCGMYNYSLSSPTVIGCTFRDNRKGMCTARDSRSLVVNCGFYGNSQRWNGGGMVIGREDRSTLINCIFSGNSADGSGGGMTIARDGSPTLINCTFSNNSAGDKGGGIYSYSGDATLINCIMWGDTATQGDEIYLYYRENSHTGQVTTVCYSDIEGGYESVYVESGCTLDWGEGNIDTNPLFVDADGVDNVFGTEDDNPRLLRGSPCVDAGDNSAVPLSVPTDIQGNPRIINGTVDMGAYEGINQGFLLSPQSLTALEGGSISFTVALAMDPLGTVEVTVTVESDDPDITVGSAATLTFDSSNYSQPQTITVEAAEDADNLNGSALICVSAAGFYTAEVSVTESDDEPITTILYVDDSAPGINNGANWAGAYTNLQVAFSVAKAYHHVEEIRVAQGQYKPAEPNGDREATFELINGVVIKGGYAGYGWPNPDARDIELYETIMSGDLNGDDVEIIDPEDLLDEPSRRENSFHVVTGNDTSDTAVLNGFTITSGNADADEYENYGGGMYNDEGRPTLLNCVFSGNSARLGGGGMYNKSSSPTLTNCTFHANSADTDGGGMGNYSSSPKVTNCTFSYNWSKGSGGGLFEFVGYIVATNCIFNGNMAGGSGGGIYGDATVNNCIFSGNSAGDGGGIYSNGIWGSKVVNCTFTGNSASRYTGGMRTKYGGTITNCIFWGNRDSSGMGQSAQFDGGAPGYRPTLSYSCIQNWTGNFMDQHDNIGDDVLFVDPGYWDDNDTPDNMSDDFWVEGDYHLQADSPCIDSGDNMAIPPAVLTDLDGNPRLRDGNGDFHMTVDKGAYEYFIDSPYIAIEPKRFSFSAREIGMNPPNQVLQIRNSGIESFAWEILEDCPWLQVSPISGVTSTEIDEITLHVDTSGLGIGSYHCQLTISSDQAMNSPKTIEVLLYIGGILNVPADYNTIQAAIDVIVEGDEIVVAPGTYNENINFKGKNITLRSTGPHDPSVMAATIIQGDGVHPVVTFEGSEDESCELSGFTITSAHPANSLKKWAPGIYGQEASPTISNSVIIGNTSSGLRYCNGPIRNCIISGNSADNGGGLSNCVGSSITNCIISNNYSAHNGGGLYRCHISITNSTIQGNSANYGGGFNRCSGSITNCTISDNSARGSGGAIYMWYSGEITNCLISSNSAGEKGGGMCVSQRRSQVTNCTITGNSAYTAGGVYSFKGSITNCIIWDNTAEQLYNCVEPTYSCIQGGSSGTGNISFDPGFTFSDDSHLTPSSPCIDAGINQLPGGYGLSKTDLDGFPRLVDGNNDSVAVLDMGAYEYNREVMRIAVSPSVTEFSALEGSSNPDSQSLFIRNVGTETMSWEITEDCSWLQVGQTNGQSAGEVNEVKLTTDITGLDHGIYSCDLRVTASAAVNSPQMVKVTLYINNEFHVPIEYATIQAALDDSIDRDKIIVAPGTYNENINFKGKNITLRSTGPHDPSVIAATIIQGDGVHPVVTFEGGEDENCELSGFTITGGANTDDGGGICGHYARATISNCIITGNSATRYGGGLYRCEGLIIDCKVNSNSADVGGGLSGCRTLTNCYIAGNSAEYSGGGMYNSGTSATLTNCTFIGNSAGDESGGMHSYNSRLTNCTFIGNYAIRDGGGICSNGGIHTLINCVFRQNSTMETGGGMVNTGHSTATLQNCIFSGNSAGKFGGGMTNYTGTSSVNNCSFSGNSAEEGGGMCVWDTTTLTNCILWRNADSSGAGESAQITTRWIIPDVNYCCVQGWTGDLGGSGSIGDDVLFVDPGYWDDNDTPDDKGDDHWVEGDYHLRPDSPCIDAGDNSVVTVDTDLDGNPRIFDGNDDGNPVVDMGAYEFSMPLLEVAMKFKPQALNCNSKGRWVKAHFVLPEGFLPEDVDADTPAVIEPLDIESDHMNVFINEDGLVEIEAAFSRAVFCASAISDDTIEVMVVGLLTTGQRFYGTDTIKIIGKSLESLAVFASHWLDADCGEPDWCNGADLNQDSTVNFVDFAMFASY